MHQKTNVMKSQKNKAGDDPGIQGVPMAFYISFAVLDIWHNAWILSSN